MLRLDIYGSKTGFIKLDTKKPPPGGEGWGTTVAEMNQSRSGMARVGSA